MLSANKKNVSFLLADINRTKAGKGASFQVCPSLSNQKYKMSTDEIFGAGEGSVTSVPSLDGRGGGGGWGRNYDL